MCYDSRLNTLAESKVETLALLNLKSGKAALFTALLCRDLSDIVCQFSDVHLLFSMTE